MLIPIEIATGKKITKKKKVTSVSPEEQAKAFDILRKQTTKESEFEAKRQKEAEANIRKRTVVGDTMVYGSPEEGAMESFEALTKVSRAEAGRVPGVQTKVAPTVKATPEGNVVKKIATKYGVVTYTATPDESNIFRSGDVDAIQQLTKNIVDDAESIAKEQGRKVKINTGDKYIFDTVNAALDERSIDTMTTNALKPIFKAIMPPMGQKASDILASSGEALTTKGKELFQSESNLAKGAGIASSLVGGILEEASNPAAFFTAKTMNVLDPTATTEERVGGGLNLAGYALSALPAIGAAGAGRAVLKSGGTATEALTAATRSLLRDVVPAGKYIDNRITLKGVLDVIEADGQLGSLTRSQLAKQLSQAAKNSGQDAGAFYTRYLNKYTEGKDLLTSPAYKASFEPPSPTAPAIPEPPVSAIPEPAVPTSILSATDEFDWSNPALVEQLRQDLKTQLASKLPDAGEDQLSKVADQLLERKKGQKNPYIATDNAGVDIDWRTNQPVSPTPTAPVVEPPVSAIPEPPVVETPASTIPEPVVEPTVAPTVEPPTSTIPDLQPIPGVSTAVRTAEGIEDVAPNEDLTSFAKRVTGRDPMEGTNAQKIMEGARKFVQDGQINVENIVNDIIRNRRPVNEVESGAVLDELAKLKAQQKQLERAAGGSVQDLEEWRRLQDKIEQYQQAGDIIGNQFHRLGMALQTVIRDDMSVGSLLRKGKLLNLNEELSAAMRAKLEDLGKKYEDALAELQKFKDKGSEIVDTVKRYQGTERFAAKTERKAIDTARNWFEGRAITGEGFKSRRAGAVNYTITNEEMKARSAIKKIAKETALDGAETLDDVLNGIRAKIGVNVKDEDLLAMIYEPYSKYKLEADLALTKSRQALRDVQRAAEFRSKDALGKFSSVFLGTLNGTARAMQAGADFSAPLIQGRKGLFANPIGWVKAYAPMFKAVTGKRAEEVALRELVKIEQHPMYGRAKAAGLELTQPGGVYTKQEENFMTNMELLLETLEKNKGLKRVAGSPLEGYLNIMVRSEDAFTTYMNALRYDTFIKMAKAAPDDPEYLKDVANIVNIIYGRGSGKVAQAAGAIGGEFAFAPKYLVSNIQYQSGVPFWKATTPKGKMQAARIYATHALAMKSILGLAALAGWKVNTDMRSSKGGTITSPDGKDTYDLYGKDTQIIRLITQMAYGKMNMKGDLTYPSNQESAKLIGAFVQGKFAPLPRAVSEMTFGTFDEKEGGVRPLNQQDYINKALPLWVGQYLKDAEKYGGDKGRQARNTILQLFGEEVTPDQVENPEIPMYYTAPGIRQKDAGPPMPPLPL
jgi:hypothetical protein